MMNNPLCAALMIRARITGLITRFDLNNAIVRVGSFVDGRYDCYHEEQCVRVKQVNLLFACERCCVIKRLTAIRTVCSPDIFLCDACVFAEMSRIDVHDDIMHTADAMFSRPTQLFHILTNHGTDAINLYSIMVDFFEHIMCGYTEENFYIEPLLFLGDGEVKLSSDVATHILTENEQALQAHKVSDIARLVKIEHDPVVVTFVDSKKKFALEYWGFKPIDGSDGHHLGGLLPLALSNVIRVDMLWCSVYVRHITQ
jgi:acetyltransferase-like isoleucine patch superfamily enzyme